ncbi:MAG TPA: ATP-binding protein, partial [Candidatus Eisenbacteria bacterium]|nr:ATP-binding protein [Candidatus Eisenbacteria bacterium]
VWLLEDRLGLPDASPVYLLAVVATALVSGTIGAVASALAGIALYDYLFTQPIHTLVISDPEEWLSLILLLFVGLVVGQLTALGRSRTLLASTREREARELFQVSRALATRQSTPLVLPEIAAVVRDATRMEAVWISLGSDDASERVAASAGGERSPAVAGFHQVLRRMPAEEPARWLRVHSPSPGRSRSAREGIDAYRVRIEAGGSTLGSIWASRPRRLGGPDRTETRLLSAAADQVGQALALDRLAAAAQAAEIARQSDALKSALLQSVSHDLRTPLAAIRAAAGTLRPESGLAPADQQASADSIEREVEYLDRMVANLLDLSRIEAGALRAELDVFELDDLLDRTLQRLRPRLADRVLTVDVPAQPVRVDPVFLDEAFTNLLENALKFTSPGDAVRVHADAIAVDGYLQLTVEDGGPGVPEAALERLFEKFYRAGRDRRTSRPGTGIGLAVVRGLTEAMGGRVGARQGDLGGLAIDLFLPVAAVPAELAGSAAAAAS